ncbi:hypothetical protein [Streptomyces decoyicus]|uniref:hypothetical protein n=1 Tax=Streptomyces decoyicus TaxID=249567 RepID=UPI0033A9BD64
MSLWLRTEPSPQEKLAPGRDLAQAGFPRTGTSDRPAEDGTAVPYQVYGLQNP